MRPLRSSRRNRCMAHNAKKTEHAEPKLARHELLEADLFEEAGASEVLDK